MKHNTGVVKSISRADDDNGCLVMRVVVDFYDGNEPEINNGTVWHRRPVTLTDSRINQQETQE